MYAAIITTTNFKVEFSNIVRYSHHTLSKFKKFVFYFTLIFAMTTSKNNMPNLMNRMIFFP